MVLNTLSMGKLRTLLATAAGGLALAGCEAGATDKKAPETAEFTKLAAVVEAAKVTREQCIALMPDKAEVKVCMLKLSEQRKAEIAVLDKDTKNTEQSIEVLSKEFQQMAREEFEKEARPQN